MRYYGWRPDHPDQRDRVYAAPAVVKFHTLPRKVSLRPNCPAVYQQAETQSCTGNVVAFQLHYVALRGREDTTSAAPPSRLFAYYNGRRLDRTTSLDAGATLRNVFKGLARWGCCVEPLWPFEPSKVTEAPAAAAYEAAVRAKLQDYSRLWQSADLIKAALSEDQPVACGVAVYSSFESHGAEASGLVPLPGTDEPQLGGHAIALTGYDDDARSFEFRNSWGDRWGDGGYGRLPYDYVLNPHLAGDFWVVRAA